MIDSQTVKSDIECTLNNEASALKNLCDVQLALVGGGCGDVLWG